MSPYRHQRPDDPDHDFTLAHYREILARITATHETLSFAQAVPLGRKLLERERFVLMRHDVEFSLDDALTIAEADHDAGVRSSFFLQLGSDYNIFENDSVPVVHRILELGHDVGLHYDVEQLELSSAEPAALARRMIDLIETFFDTKVHAVSPHMPMRSGRRLEIEGVVDAYDPLYFTEIKYFSDSTQVWREGVVTKLLDDHDQIQLLTHEYYWSEEGHPFDVLLLREAWRKYRRLHERAEANILKFRQGLRLRAERDRKFRERVDPGSG